MSDFDALAGLDSPGCVGTGLAVDADPPLVDQLPRLRPGPAEARLETFPNPAPRRNYWIHFETDDFTSVCPVTGQPDFARIDIDYIPDRLCVESKSLKFYLASYRNERAFNEAVTNRILDDFVKACAPREATVTAQFSARGGIAQTVRAEYPDKNPNRDEK